MDDKYNPTSEGVEAYYNQSAPAYRNWGPDPERDGIYALHFGYAEDGGVEDNWGQVKAMTQHVIESIDVHEGDCILDAGCGTGALSFEIAEQFPQSTVVGVNITQTHVDTATQYAKTHGINNVTFLRESFEATSLADATMDKVLFMESFCHGFDKSGTIAEVARVLKSSGSLFISDIFLCGSEYDQDIQVQINAYERGWVLPPLLNILSLVELLGEQGFVDIEVNTVTDHTLPSIKLMADHAAMRLEQDTTATDVITASRKACVATYALTTEGVAGYFQIKARKA